MSNVIAVVDALVAPDLSPLPLRDMWWQRSVRCVADWLNRLAEAAREGAIGAEVAIGELRRMPPQAVGRALNRPVPLWCLQNSDRRVLVAGAALAACDVEAGAHNAIDASVARLCMPLGSPLALMGSGHWLDPATFAVHGFRDREFVSFGGSRIALASRDAVLAGSAIDGYPKLQTDAEIAEFGRCVDDALSLLRWSTPGFFRSMERCLSCIVPMRPPERGVPSSSTNSVPGAVCITATSDSALVAEQLTHEVSHAHLFALQEDEPLLAPDAHGDGWGTPLSYSPWRDDPRPLNGLLHGAVVFSRVAWLHARLADRLPTSRRRLAAIGPQVRAALELLSQHATMTPAGMRLLRGLAESERMLSSLCPEWSGVSEEPLYVECSSILGERGPAWVRQAAHRARCLEGTAP